MQLIEFLTLYQQHPHIQSLKECLLSASSKRLYTSGLVGSARSLMFGALHHACALPILVIMDDAEAAAYCYNDLSQTLGKENVNLFPSSFRRSPKHGEIDTANVILRTDTLNKIASGKNFLVITSAEGLAEKVVSEQTLENKCLHLKVGDVRDTTELSETLIEFGFNQVDFVYEPGQFSLRGSIVDVFSFTFERPYRLDFFGDDIESIRTFDIEKQLSLDHVESISIVANISEQSDSERVSLFDFLPENTRSEERRVGKEC